MTTDPPPAEGGVVALLFEGVDELLGDGGPGVVGFDELAAGLAHAVGPVGVVEEGVEGFGDGGGVAFGDDAGGG